VARRSFAGRLLPRLLLLCALICAGWIVWEARNLAGRKALATPARHHSLHQQYTGASAAGRTLKVSIHWTPTPPSRQRSRGPSWLQKTLTFSHHG
jgi:hypothetical protein